VVKTFKKKNLFFENFTFINFPVDEKLIDLTKNDVGFFVGHISVHVYIRGIITAGCRIG